MSEQTPGIGEGTDIDAAELDLDAPVDPPATSDAEELLDDGETLGGTGGLNAGGVG
jgi:hypothetical protein